MLKFALLMDTYAYGANFIKKLILVLNDQNLQEGNPQAWFRLKACFGNPPSLEMGLDALRLIRVLGPTFLVT